MMFSTSFRLSSSQSVFGLHSVVCVESLTFIRDGVV